MPYRYMDPLPDVKLELCCHEHEDCNGSQWVCLEPKSHSSGHVWQPVQGDLRCKKWIRRDVCKPDVRCIRYVDYPGRCLW